MTSRCVVESDRHHFVVIRHSDRTTSLAKILSIESIGYRPQLIEMQNIFACVSNEYIVCVCLSLST